MTDIGEGESEELEELRRLNQSLHNFFQILICLGKLTLVRLTKNVGGAMKTPKSNFEYFFFMCGVLATHSRDC